MEEHRMAGDRIKPDAGNRIKCRRSVWQVGGKGGCVLPVHTLQPTVYVNVTTVLLKGDTVPE